MLDGCCFVDNSYTSAFEFGYHGAGIIACCFDDFNAFFDDNSGEGAVVGDF